MTATGLGRRNLLAASAAALAMPAIGQDMRAKTLHFVPSANLTFLDPIWTTAGVTSVHGFAVFDTLYGVDSQLRPRPQMAEGHELSDDKRVWTFRLRPGLRFHDGEPVLARDCVASLIRWSKRDSFGQALDAFTDRMEVVDDRTFRIRLKRPMGPLLDALAHPTVSVAFIMPERLATTDPFKQVTEMVGSGPFRFLPGEFVSGSRVAYEKFEKYVPRDEPADYTSGGKRVYFDRLEWHIIPDPATAAAALQSGEVDMWEYILLDLAPMLAKNPNLTVQNCSPFGLGTLLRFNFLNPPFSDRTIRRAVLTALNQREFVEAIVGSDPNSYRLCRSMFGCGLPGVHEIDAGAPPDIETARQAIRTAGYKGEKIVVLDPIDYTFLSSGSRLAADLLRKLGFNVEVQSMDFGTLMQRRNSKEPTDRGGWSVFCTGADWLSLANPAINYYIRGAGGWTGWYENPKIERLTEAWLASPDPVVQQTLFDEIQNISWQEVPIVPLGQWQPRNAFRRTLTGIVPTTATVLWNIRRV